MLAPSELAEPTLPDPKRLGVLLAPNNGEAEEALDNLNNGDVVDTDALGGVASCCDGVELLLVVVVAWNAGRVGVENVLLLLPVALVRRDGEKDLVRLGDASCMASTAANRADGGSILAEAGGSLRKAGRGRDCHLSRRA